MMYGMVYDFDHTPLKGVLVYIDGRKTVETDIHGRFVIEFKKPGDYTVKLSKTGYEDIEQNFAYDPMNILYFNMINAAQLLALAEEALDQGVYAGTETLLDRALLLEPHRPDIQYLRGIVLFLQRRDTEARAALERLARTGFQGPVRGLLERME
jgi:hypothetical protein